MRADGSIVVYEIEIDYNRQTTLFALKHVKLEIKWLHCRLLFIKIKIL